MNSYIYLSGFILLCGTCFIKEIIVSAGPIIPKQRTKVEVDNNGDYRLHVDNETWLEGAPPFFYVDDTKCSVDAGNLEVVMVNKGSFFPGSPYHEYGITYRCNDTYISATIKNYVFNFVTFDVTYINGTNNTQAKGEQETISGFPGFKMDSDVLPLGFLTYSDKQISSVHTGRWNSSAVIPGGLEGSGPVALFDQTGRCLVASQADNFMVSANWKDNINNRLYWGIIGSIDQIPEGFAYKTIIVFQSGIQKAFSEWSTWLTFVKSHDDSLTKLTDYSKHKLGYWTSKGSAYYDGPETGKTYEETIKDVKNQLAKSPYPNIGYVQLGNWWYIKDVDGKIKNWKSSPSNLPNGLHNLRSATNFEFIAYAGLWSPDNVYKNNYTFLVENNTVLPTDKQFWLDLFSSANTSGITTYQQGKMGETFLAMNSTKTKLYLARDWLQQMADAATRNNINIIYNDAYPRQIFQSSYTKSVTQVKVGNGDGDWKIGAQSLFLSALGLAPSIGVFSSKSVGGTFDPELLEVVAILSGGSVGFGDAVGSADSNLISRCCDTAGNILRPDNIALPIDLQIIEQAFHNGSGPVGEVWSTVTSLAPHSTYDTLNYGTIFVNELQGRYKIYPSTVNLKIEASTIYHYNKTVIIHQDFDENNPITLHDCKTKFCLYHTAPSIFLSENFYLYEYVIFGDLSKWIPVTKSRITHIHADGLSLSLNVSAAPGEIVPISYLVNKAFITVDVPTDEDGHGFYTIYSPQTPPPIKPITKPSNPVSSAITLSMSQYFIVILFLTQCTTSL